MYLHVFILKCIFLYCRGVVSLARSTILILYFIRNLLVHFYIQLSNSLNKLFVRFEAHLVKIIQFNYFVTLFLALSAIF